MNYKLPYFEEVDLSQLEEYYQVDIEQYGQSISIDLNLKKKKIEAQVFGCIKVLLENIERQDKRNRASINLDFINKDGEIVREYLKFHIEELKEELTEIIDFNDPQNDPKIQLMEKLKLVRIGFYPDGKYGSESFATFDYTVDRKITDELIVVNVDKKGGIMNLAWES